MNHSFNVEIAERYGVHSAIILQHLIFWIKHNEENKINFHDGCYWTFNSKRAFTEQFPYLSERQIRYAIDKLLSEGIIKTANYNKRSYDRTLWYALTEKGMTICQNCQMDVTKLSNGTDEIVKSNCQKSQMDLTESSNGTDEIVKPIPDINSDVTSNTNSIRKSFKNNEDDKHFSPSSTTTKSTTLDIPPVDSESLSSEDVREPVTDEQVYERAYNYFSQNESDEDKVRRQISDLMANFELMRLRTNEEKLSKIKTLEDNDRKSKWRS